MQSRYSADDAAQKLYSSGTCGVVFTMRIAAVSGRTVIGVQQVGARPHDSMLSVCQPDDATRGPRSRLEGLAAMRDLEIEQRVPGSVSWRTTDHGPRRASQRQGRASSVDRCRQKQNLRHRMLMGSQPLVSECIRMVSSAFANWHRKRMPS